MEDYLISNLSTYIGETDVELKKRFRIDKPSNKSTLVELAYKMAGVSSNRRQELKDQNIAIKTIRINSKGKIVESMSFPTIKFSQLVQEDWEDSYIYNYFVTTKLLFVVYKEMDFGYKFLGGTYWKMSDEDLNIVVKKEWQDIQDTVLNGLVFNVKKGSVSNNLPKKSQTEVIHLRPKAQKAAYSLHNGFNCGDIKKDADQLPNGEWMTKQCFWLNNDYVLKQIEKESINVKYTNNMLSLSEYQIDVIKKYLDEEFYLVEDFKRIFFSVLDVDDEKYFNVLNIIRTGYRFNFSYVYSNKYESINEYVESILMSEEIVDLRKAVPKLLDVVNIGEILDDMVKELPIIRIQRNVFVNKGRLYRGGFREERFDVITNYISSKYEGSYFTIEKLRKSEMNESLFNDGFEDCFYEDVLTCSGLFKAFEVGKRKIFSSLNQVSKLSSFIEFIVGEHVKMEISDLSIILSDEYGVNIKKINIERALRFSDLYFNKDIQKVFTNHDVFIKDLKDIN